MSCMFHEFEDLSLQSHLSRVMLREGESVMEPWECETGAEAQTDTEEETNCGFQLRVSQMV